MFLSGIQIDRWPIMRIGPLDSRLKRAGMTELAARFAKAALRPA
jgi:hypothetical protein